MGSRKVKELVFTVDRNSSEPMYHQVYMYIRKQIMKGKIQQNQKLPSVRQLAVLLNVSRNTTQVAYEQLAAEGYITSEFKKGYYVLANITDNSLAYKPKKEHVIKHEEKVKDTIDFKTGTVDQTNFPINKWRSTSNKILNDSLMFSYGEKQGDQLLREQLCDYLFQSRGVIASSEQVIIGSSTQHLLMILTFLLRGDHQHVAVEDPGYTGARDIFSLQSFTIQPLSLKEDRIDVEQLKHLQSRLVYLTPTHQFPLGGTIPINERLELIDWAERVKGYVIEDDYDSEFRYDHHPFPSLQSIDRNDRVVYLSTFSKALLPSIRISFMILPKRLLQPYKKITLSMEQTASSHHQRTLALFMKNGYWYAHLRKMRVIYKRKMKVLYQLLHDQFKDTVVIKGVESGIYIVLEIRINKSEDQLIRLAYQNGVTVYPCSQYFYENTPSFPHIQLGFGNLSEDKMKEGVARLHKAWFTSPSI